MRWQGRRGSSNIEDRRRSPVRTGGSIGIVGMLLILGLGYVFGVDVTPLLQGQGGGSAQIETGELTEADKRAGEFVSVTLADTEEIWAEIFRRQVGKPYNPATLVLFKGITQSPCGNASGATGPFYCPADRKVYLDTNFFTTMQNRMGAGGDFAAAYVVAHEVARIMCRTNWASSGRPTASAARSARRSRTRSAFESNCRRIAILASGRALRMPGSTRWNGAILPKR